MNYDEEATAAAMRKGQKAMTFENSRRYEEAIYFYTEAANSILQLLRMKKILPILKKNALEFIERAEFLQRELPRLLELYKNSKSPNQVECEKGEFLMLKAQDLDEKGHMDLAIDMYHQSIEICMTAGKNSGDPELRRKMHQVATLALQRAEELSLLRDERKIDELTQNLPDVPMNALSLDDKAPEARGTPAGGSTPSTPPDSSPSTSKSFNQSEKLTKEEISVLAATSNINGKSYVPFLPRDLKEEKFGFTLPFTDKDGKLALTEKQKKRIKAWLRPDEIMEDPKLICSIDSGTIKQTVISDCSFVSSLSIAARYERRFNKQLVTSIIFPQNKAGIPVYNPSGKYMIKFHINGVWRKVIVDDYFPTGETMDLLCSYSQQKGELWVSLLEKAYMKVMGGYDFPGSNSNIDLHALTGWIPERISISKDASEFDGDKIFEKLLSRFHSGDCLITLATGKLDQETCDRAGLVDTHAYAVLDLRKLDGKRLLMVKNPWTHLRWKGRYSENDNTCWTPALCKALDYDPKKAKEKDDGVFWIDFESVCNFFDVFYVNWNPGLFPFTKGLHACWNACNGPVKDLYSVADNPQFSLSVNNKTSTAVWILLTRHITDIADFADNKEYISLMVYKTNKKVYIPIDPKPIFNGVRINSPHALCQLIITEKGLQSYTLVVAQHEKSTTIYYTLRVYSSSDFQLHPIKVPYMVKKTDTGKWEGKSAGGCGNGPSRETAKNNPTYKLSLEQHSDENCILIDLKGPKQYSVGFDVWQISSPRNKPFEKTNSGTYRPGYTVLQLESVPAGDYAIRPMTFMSGQEGPFILKVEATCGFSLSRIS